MMFLFADVVCLGDYSICKSPRNSFVMFFYHYKNRFNVIVVYEKKTNFLNLNQSRLERE